MAELLAFSGQIASIVGVRMNLDRHLFDDVQAITFESNHFAWVIREQTNGFEAQISQNLRSETILAKVHSKTEFLVRLDRVVALLLKLISLNLGSQPDASAFLTHIDDDTCAFFGY